MSVCTEDKIKVEWLGGRAEMQAVGAHMAWVAVLSSPQQDTHLVTWWAGRLPAISMIQMSRMSSIARSQ